MSYLKRLCLTQSHEQLPLCILHKSFTVLVISFRSLIHFELVFT